MTSSILGIIWSQEADFSAIILIEIGGFNEMK